MKELLEEMETNAIIKKGCSPYLSNVILHKERKTIDRAGFESLIFERYL